MFYVRLLCLANKYIFCRMKAILIFLAGLLFPITFLFGQSAVYGRVSGDVRLTDTALVISGEEIQNDTLDTLVISGQGRSVIRDDSRDELAPQTGQPEPSKAKIKERQVER